MAAARRKGLQRGVRNSSWGTAVATWIKVVCSKGDGKQRMDLGWI